MAAATLLLLLLMRRMNMRPWKGSAPKSVPASPPNDHLHLRSNLNKQAIVFDFQIIYFFATDTIFRSLRKYCAKSCKPYKVHKTGSFCKASKYCAKDIDLSYIPKADNFYKSGNFCKAGLYSTSHVTLVKITQSPPDLIKAPSPVIFRLPGKEHHTL